jgi:DivIVA domain-containing protein
MPSPVGLAPEDVSTRAFSSSFRGLNESEVRSFLQRVADELSRAHGRIVELERQLDARRSAPDDAAPLDEGALLDALGEETTKLLRNAREAARDIRTRAEETSARLRGDAQEDADRVRAEAAELLDAKTREADAVAAETLARADAGVEERRREVEVRVAAELDEAKTRGRAMVDEARAVRERMLADLAHRRGLLQAQIAELRAGRDHLLDAYRSVKRTFLDATDALAAVEARFAQSRPLPLDDAEIEAALRPDPGETASAELAESLEPDTEPVVDEANASAAAAEANAADDVAPASPSDATDAAGPTDTTDTTDTATDDGADDGPAVGDLFARIRAEANETEPEAGLEPHTESEPEPAATDATDAVTVDAGDPQAGASDAGEVDRPDPRERAATALAPVLASGAKRAKRALQDDQNRVLDALRRHKGKPQADAVLPSEEEQIATWKTVIGDALARGYIAGRRDVDPDQSVTVDVPDDLAQDNTAVLLSTLRERLVAALEHHDAEGASDRVSARYREWKSQDLEARLEDVVRSAYARGVYDAAAEGSELRWVVAQPRCCADCADNALEPVTKGKTFPTGQQHPPAHPGCRCVLEVRTELAGGHL